MLKMETSALTAAIGSITGALTEFSSANVVSVIVAGLGVAVPLVLVWFAFRFIYRKAKVALKRGS
jgi:hypothetical protein